MWWLLFLVHIIISVIYGIIAIAMHKQNGLCRFIVVLFIPLGGIFFFVFLDLYDRIYRRKGEIDLNAILSADQILNISRITVPEYEKEMNIISIEEALSINENKIRREIMLDVLKKDATKYISQLKNALGNEDTETSHYAAAALVEIKRKYELVVQELSVKMEKDPNNYDLSIGYMDALNKYINSDLLDRNNKRKQQYSLVNVGERIIIANPANLQLEKYNALIENLIDLKEYTRAEECAKLCISAYPQNEEPYIKMLKLYYLLGRREAFASLLDKLRNSNILLSNKALGILRFWIGGVMSNASATTSTN